MKSLLVYNVVQENKRYPDDLVIRYLRAQIDNSFRLGWKSKDIVIATNFPFNYNSISNVELEDICTVNLFNNKWYGMNELFKKGLMGEDFWFHDQDAWQIDHFDFPTFNNYIGGCTYVGTSEWNTASLFVRKESADLLEFIREFLETNKNLSVPSDENYISILRNHPTTSRYFETLTNEFNVGCTYFEKRYSNCSENVKVCGFKPHLQSDFEKFNGKNTLGVKLIPEELDKIFKEHSIHYSNTENQKQTQKPI